MTLLNWIKHQLKREKETTQKAQDILKGVNEDVLKLSSDIKRDAERNQQEFKQYNVQLRDVAREIARASGNT